MVLGFILYEGVELTYNFLKLGFKIISSSYRWYYGIKPETEQNKILRLENRIEELEEILVDTQKDEFALMKMMLDKNDE